MSQSNQMMASAEAGGNLMFSKDILHTAIASTQKTTSSAASSLQSTNKLLLNKSLHYIFLLTTRKDAQQGSGSSTAGGSMLAVDDNEGNPTLSHGILFKSCITDRPHTLSTVLSRDRNAYSGVSQYSPGDYIVAAQALKPLLQVFQWGKPQPLYHITTQEINTCLATDPTGNFVFTGTKKGYIYVWHVMTGELLTVWQAHFQTVQQLVITENQQFLLSISEDGMCKVWDLAQILDTNLFTTASLKMSASNQRTIIPFRSWSAHNLAVTGVYVLECFSSLRVITCSVDRSIHIYDVYANKSMVKYTLPQPLQHIICNPTLDYILCGTSSGLVYRIDFSVLAAGFSASKSNVVFSNGKADSAGQLGHGVTVIEAHTQAITNIIVTPDNHRMVTTSEDGMLKIWSLHTRQLLKEISPFSKAPITNCQLMLRPDCIDPTLNKPSICPIVPLKKYMDQDGKNVGKVYFGPTIVGNALNKAIKSPISIVSSTNIDRAMKGFGKTRSTKTEKVAEDDNEEEEQEEEQEEEEAEEVEDEQSDELDFVPLGKDEYEDYVESEESEDDNGEEEEDNESSNEELAQAMEKIQQLEKDAAHWKQLCVEMQSFIQHHPDGKQVPIVDSTSEEKKRKRNRKRNKNKAVSDDNEEEEAEEAEPVVEEKVSEAGTKKQKKQKLLREQATKQDTEEEDYIEQEKQFAVKAKKFKAVDPSDAEYQTKFSKAERKRQKLLSLRKAAM